MQQGCKGQMQKVTEEGNRNNSVFPVNVLNFPDLIFCPDALSQTRSWGKRQKRCQHCSALMAVGGAAFPGVPDLPSTAGEMNTCYHLPATVSCHLIWLSGGKGPRVSPPAPPFSAQTPARQPQKGSLTLLPEAQVSAEGSWAPSLSAPSHRESLRKVAVPFSTELLLGRRNRNLKVWIKISEKRVFSLLCFWNPQCISNRMLPTQSLPAGKQVLKKL